MDIEEIKQKILPTLEEYGVKKSRFIWVMC